jgi:hypothetical protein
LGDIGAGIELEQGMLVSIYEKEEMVPRLLEKV